MDFFKRLFTYILIILLCISIYNDIKKGATHQHEPEQVETANDIDVSIIKRKVEPGDTVLSITEQINTFSHKNMNVRKILADFKTYNPNADPNHLHVNDYYYFLHYDDT